MSTETIPAPESTASWRDDLRVLRRGPLRSLSRRQWRRFSIIVGAWLMITGPVFLALGSWIGAGIGDLLWPPVN